MESNLNNEKPEVKPILQPPPHHPPGPPGGPPPGVGMVVPQSVLGGGPPPGVVGMGLPPGVVGPQVVVPPGVVGPPPPGGPGGPPPPVGGGPPGVGVVMGGGGEHKPPLILPPPPPAHVLPYNPFKTLITDENKLIYQRHYDEKWIAYMRDAEVRVAHQLALAYFRDANPMLGNTLVEFRDRDIVVLDREDRYPPPSAAPPPAAAGAGAASSSTAAAATAASAATITNNNTIHLIFTKNCIKHLNVTAEEFEDIHLNPFSQTLVLSDDFQVSDNCVRKIWEFVSSGGLVLSFNKAISVVDRAFPNMVKYHRGETTVDKPIDVVIADSEDKNIFLGLENAAQRKKCVRLSGTRRLSILPGAEQIVEPLVQEIAPTQCPLALKIHAGMGLIFHILPVGTNEVLELHSKAKVQAYCKQVEAAQNISLATKSAWKTAFSSGLQDSFYLAISLLPLLDIIFGIIKKYRRNREN